MGAQHAENPAARPAHRGDFGDRLVEHAGVEFVAAIALRLHRAQEAQFLELRDGLVGQAAQFLGPPCPLGQRRQQSPRALQILIRCHDRLPNGNRPRRAEHGWMSGSGSA